MTKVFLHVRYIQTGVYFVVILQNADITDYELGKIKLNLHSLDPYSIVRFYSLLHCRT